MLENPDDLGLEPESLPIDVELHLLRQPRRRQTENCAVSLIVLARGTRLQAGRAKNVAKTFRRTAGGHAGIAPRFVEPPLCDPLTVFWSFVW